jgi:hypothetical protein
VLPGGQGFSQLSGSSNVCARQASEFCGSTGRGWQLFFLISSRLAAGPAESRSDVSAHEDGAAKSRSGVFAREGGAAGDPGMDSLQRFIEN